MSRRFHRSSHSSRTESGYEEEAGPSYEGPRPRRAPITKSQSQRSERDNDDDSDEDSPTQSRHQVGDLPEDEENHVLGTLLKFLLYAAHCKHPIKQSDIKSYGIPLHVKHFTYLMAKAKVLLHEIFGHKLMNIGGGKWMIVNAFPNHEIKVEVRDIRSETVLFLALSHIFMSGGKCSEDSLVQFYNSLDLWRGGHCHPYFGNVFMILHKVLIPQLYLIRSKVAESESEMYDYEWGPRAKEECDPRVLIEFVAKVFNRPANSWNTQFQKAHRLETPQA